ncbi:hypothetical protein [Brevibacillus daliensis]|uniref:hypothetical protein n=1 Tax=Brevibacillus daliensis TaxID=2892995 RepID=UPI001E5411FD|nr:hypothetical protein [Brevibacillus daliensis]
MKVKKYALIVGVMVLSFVLGGCGNADEVNKEKVQEYMNSLAELYNSEMQIKIEFGPIDIDDPEGVKKVEELFNRSQKVYNDFQLIEPPSEEFKPSHEKFGEAISAYAKTVEVAYDTIVKDKFVLDSNENTIKHHEAKKDFRVQIEPLLEKYSVNFPIDQTLEQQLK